ncbi:MAG: flagellar hook-length control protein FliK [Pseudomonadota bacterium]
MIENLSINALPNDAAPRRKDDAARSDASGFSYALAAATLEKSAAQSLKTHGATPDGGAASASGERAATTHSGKGGDKTLTSGREANASPQAEPSPKSNPAAAPAKTNAAAPAVAATVLTPAPSVVSGAPAALPAKAADAAVIRDLASAKAKTAPLKAPRIQPLAPALKAEFAEILARRLEKTSVFELRLDPPELGRVDGRLAVKDDGKAVLTMTFDNQNAFDLYSRDEQALRHMLAESGLNFSSGDFVFAFKDRHEAAAPQSDFAMSQGLKSPDAYEPLFHADWSAGALDIRI